MILLRKSLHLLAEIFLHSSVQIFLVQVVGLSVNRWLSISVVTSGIPISLTQVASCWTKRTLGRKKLEQVQELWYLCDTITKGGRSNGEIDKSISLKKSFFCSKKTLLTSSNMRFSANKNFFQTHGNQQGVAAYGCLTLTHLSQTDKTFESF